MRMNEITGKELSVLKKKRSSQSWALVHSKGREIKRNQQATSSHNDASKQIKKRDCIVLGTGGKRWSTSQHLTNAVHMWRDFTKAVIVVSRRVIIGNMDKPVSASLYCVLLQIREKVSLPMDKDPQPVHDLVSETQLPFHLPFTRYSWIMRTYRTIRQTHIA